MSSLFRAQRRAEHFDSLLEGSRPDPIDPRTAELLEVVGALRSVPAPQPRPEFVADLRERLMVAAETELAVAPARERDDVARLTIKPTRTRGQRRVGLALGAAALVGATTSMAVASQSAIPGDPLYPLKRTIENTQAGFSVGDDAKGETILANASSRLDEVDELTQQDDPDATLVVDTLNTFADQADEAGTHLINDFEAHGDEGSIQELNAFTHSSIETLSALAPVIPAAAHDALTDAAQGLFALDARAHQLCPECGEPMSELPPVLAAGAAAVDDATDAVAGGQLPGAAANGDIGQDNGPKGDQGKPSTLNPPETPLTIPTAIPTPSDPATTLGTVIPSTGTDTGTGTGGTGGTGGGHQGGKGGKTRPVDLSPVTDTVNEVVTGVVEGVNDALDGLTNGLTGTGQ